MAYDIAGALQNPNIIGNAIDAGRQGAADGLQAQAQQKQNALASLSSQAYTTPMASRNTLLSKMAAIDPDSANKQSQAFATMDANQKAQVASGLDQFAHTAASIAQDPDEQRSTAAYNQMIEHLASTGKDVSQFRNVPPKVGAQMALVQIASTKDLLAASGIGADQGTVVAPGGALVNKTTGAAMFRNPAALQYHDVPMGEGKAAGAFDPSTGAIRPATVGGSAPTPPAGDPMQPFIDQANHAVQLGADPNKVQAWLVQQAQGAGLNPQAPGAAPQSASQSALQGQPQVPAQFGIGTPKASASSLPSGYRMKADGSGSLEPIPGGPADKSGVSAVSLGDPNQRGDAFLQTISDPSMRAQIQAIAEGRMPLPKVSRPGKNGEISPQTIQQAVAQYDPTYDQADPTSRIKARNDFTSGKSGVQLRQLNTLLGHLGGLADAADKLDNTGSTVINAGLNAVGSTYNSKVSNFDAAARPAAEEFAALLKGGVPSVEEIKQAHDMLSANKTPEQLHGVIGTMAAQIQSRIAALHAQAQNSLGPFASKVQIITPEGQAALDKLRERGLIGKFDLGEPGTQPAQQAASQHRAVNPQTGHAVVWNGSAWVPE